MWALGATLHFLLGGIHPFLHDDEEVMNRKISHGQFDFTSPYWFHISSPAKELVRLLLTKNPLERCTASKAVVSHWMLASLAETSRQVNVDLFNQNYIRNGKRQTKTNSFFNSFFIHFLCIFISYSFLDDISEDLQAKYHIYHVLGKGAYGLVKKGVSRATKDEVAIKIYDLRKMSSRARQSIEKEVEILTEFDHPNIVKAIDSFKDNHRQRFYFVMQLVVGGELLERISKKIRYTEREARAMVKKLLETIKFIHDRQIAHR
jgi:serine/threonine protein kinase